MHLGVLLGVLSKLKKSTPVLLDSVVRSAEPKAKPYKLFDGRGLYLLVMPRGGKRWRFKYRYGGKEKLLALGTYPDVGVKAARQLLDEARKLLTRGTDPGEQRKTKKEAAQTLRANTFAALAEAWYAKKAPGWAPATAQKTRLYLDRDLIPALGARPIAEIRRPDLVETLRRFESRDAHNVAKKARQWLSGVFRYALAAGVIEISPATHLEIVAAPAPPARQHAHLPLTELPDFLRALQSYGGELSTRHAIYMLLLTAVRPGELRGALWDEFDLDSATWLISSERMKMRRPHVVPLPVQAVAILREMRELTCGTGLVFTSRGKHKNLMSENTLNVAIGRLGYKGRQTGHGFRHLVSTALNELGYNRDWIERQLAHGDANEIRGVYNKAEYLNQRREMMQAWADYLDTLREGRNVVAMRAGQIGAKELTYKPVNGSAKPQRAAPSIPSNVPAQPAKEPKREEERGSGGISAPEVAYKEPARKPGETVGERLKALLDSHPDGPPWGAPPRRKTADERGNGRSTPPQAADKEPTPKPTETQDESSRRRPPSEVANTEPRESFAERFKASTQNVKKY